MPAPTTSAATSRGPPTEALAGLVERVTFHNAETGFCVLRVKVRGQRDLVTVVGHAALISAGEFVSGSGAWVNDRTHGLQFKAHVPEGDRADHARGHREVPRLRHDPRHRPGLRQEAGRGLRRGGVRHDRAEPERLREVDRHRPEARRAHHRRLGRAEGRSARSWCSCTRTASAPRGRCGSTRPMAPTPCSVISENPYRLARDIRGIGFKTADQIAVQARHRADGHDPGARRHLLCPGRGHGAGPLRPARRTSWWRSPQSLLEIPGELVRTALEPGAAEAGDGRRRHGGEAALRLPGRPVPGRAGDRRAAAAPRRRHAALAARSMPSKAIPWVERQDRPDPGREPAGGGAPGARCQGAGHHRRPGRRQDHAGQLDPEDPRGQGREHRSSAPRPAAPPSA